VGVAWDEEQRRDVDVQKAVFAVKHAAVTISERMIEGQHESEERLRGADRLGVHR
jgi:hypothetical protein